MYAASLGWSANYTERPTMRFSDFLRAGLNRGSQTGQRSSLSELVRDSDDIVFYRHWHGPLLTYWLMAIAPLHLDEFGTRSSLIVFHLIAFLVIYFGTRWIVPGAMGRVAAFFCSAFYLFGFSNIKTCSVLSPHPLFVLFYLATLYVVAKMTVSADFRLAYLAAAGTALAFCNLEVTLALLGTLPVCVFLFRQDLFAGWTPSRIIRFAAGASALFAGAVLVLWPGAWLKLSFLKSYLFMAYLAASRKNAFGSSNGVISTWMNRFTGSPLEWLLIAFAVLIFMCSRKCRGTLRMTIPFLLYAGLMLVLVARVNADDPRYLSPILPAIQVFAGIVLSFELMRLRRLPRVLLMALLCFGIVWTSHRQFLANPISATSAGTAVLKCLEPYDLRGKNILVPVAWLPTVHFYLRGVRLKSYSDATELPGLLQEGAFDGILYANPDVRYEPLPPQRTARLAQAH
jgi:hypothetical protein